MPDTLYLLTAFDGTGNNRSVDVPDDTTIDQIKMYPGSRYLPGCFPRHKEGFRS